MVSQKVVKESAAMSATRVRVDALYAQAVGKSCGAGEITEMMIPHFEFYLKHLLRRFFIPGADAQDLSQEALAGLATAACNFDGSRGMGYFDYATLCMRNAVLAAVRKANRNKQKVLSESVRLEAQPMDLPCENNPCDQAIGRITVAGLMGWIDKELSQLEAATLKNWLAGTGVSELSERWSLEAKKIENALFRARRKAKSYLQVHHLGIAG